MPIIKHLQHLKYFCFMSNSQHLNKRECLWCKNSITGRSDKKFCNTSCKSYHKRAIELTPAILTELPPSTAHPMLIAQALFARDPRHVLLYCFWDDESYENDGLVVNTITDEQRGKLYAFYQIVLRYQERMDSFHSQYAEVMEAYLGNSYDVASIQLLDAYIEDIAKAISAYGQHQELNTPGHIAHYRLSDLHLVYYHVQSQRRNLTARLAKGEEPYIRSICSYLPSRHQSYLWGNLLGIE
jgi:hypothetical protein